MNSRLKKLFGTAMLGCLINCSVVKADPLSVSEQSSQSNESSGVVESIYDDLVGGESALNISDGDGAGLRPDIDVSKPKENENKSNVVNNDNGSSVNYNQSLGDSIADFAFSLVGKPYVYGSTGPNSFDCSGFVVYVFKKFGINLPRTSQSQAYVGKRISKSELKPGDLIFSNTYGTLSHVGIYVGNNKFVHAANSSTGVTVSNINDGYYGPRYAWATRPY